MALANPLWGSPRIHGELLKLGLEVSQRTIARLIPRRPKPPSQTWRTFLQNHLADLVSVDFFVVPTATFRVLYVFVVLLHHRRRVVHFSVTDSPTAAWTAQQIVEAFPDDSAPRYLLRDRDNIYRCEFRRRVGSMGIAEVLTAPCSPWQNPYAERMIGTIRRELLDHVIVIDERHLRHQLHRYLRYYHGSRTHLSLAKDAPEPRAVEHPELGRVVALPQVGGLHHRYTRCTRPGYFLEPRRSCSRGLLLLILCGDVRCTRAVDGGAVPFARIACGRERASPTATGGCEEQAAAQASDVQGLAALDDRATDEVDSFVAGDGDAGAAGYGASVAPEGIPPSVAMAVWNSRPKTDALRDADPRDDGAKP